MKQIKSFNLTDEQIEMIRELSTAFQCSASEVVGRAIELNYAKYFKEMDKKREIDDKRNELIGDTSTICNEVMIDQIVKDMQKVRFD